ncbi:MAG: rhomboid family intramembrane serine protease [Bacteroidota bacterium]
MDFAQLLHNAPITSVLLLANVLVGIYTLSANPELIDRWAFKPYRVIREKEWSRWVTAGFVHAGFMHLAFNMWALFLFGPYVETRIGPVRYALMYLGAELAANALTYWKHRDSPSYSAVGASGAISGVLFAFCLFEPFSVLQLIIPPIPVWAIVFAFFYVAISIYASSRGGGRIAHEAHLGGALGGLVLTILLYPAAVSIFVEQVVARFGG